MWFSLSNADYIHTSPNFVLITEPADVRVPNGARTFTPTELILKLDMFFCKLHRMLINSCSLIATFWVASLDYHTNATHLWLLTHWGRVTHICVGKLTIIGSDNGLSPGRRQAIIWTNAGILLIWPLGTNFSEILIAIETFSFNKMHLKISSAKWRPFCLGLNVLNKIMAKTPDRRDDSTQGIQLGMYESRLRAHIL